MLVGHSAGACVILTAMRSFPISESPFVAVFLVEPMIIRRELFRLHAKERRDVARKTMQLTLRRRDSWHDRDAAAAYLRRRSPWKFWDPRVLDRYVRYGLRQVDSPQGPIITIKTNKHQEGLAYVDFEPHIDAPIYFRERCTTIPFHLIFSGNADYLPRYMQDALCDASEGYKPASVVQISNTGHFIVQEQPDRLAEAICHQLNAGERGRWARL